MDNIEWKHGKHELDCLNGYESPVAVYYEDMLTRIRDSADGQIMAEIKMYVDVDKDELIKAMNYDRNQYATGYRNGYADAQKHGKWIPVDSYSAFGGEESAWMAHGNPVAYHYCSECKNQCYVNEEGEELLTDYCPNCGARMEE